jgi:hypothetical protein
VVQNQLGQIVRETLSQKYPTLKGLVEWLSGWRACLASVRLLRSNPSTIPPPKKKEKKREKTIATWKQVSIDPMPSKWCRQ